MLIMLFNNVAWENATWLLSSDSIEAGSMEPLDH